MIKLHLKDQWPASLGAILTIAAALVLPALLLMAANTTETVQESAQVGAQAEIMMAAGTTPDAAQALVKDLKGWGEVVEARVQTPEQNLQALTAQFGPLEGLGAAALPTTVQVRLHSGDGLVQAHKRLGELSARADVEAVQTGKAEVAALGGAMEPLRGLLYGLAVVMALVGLLGVSSVLGLGIFRRREEIEVMHHLGAADKQLVKPFVVQSLWLGLVGGALAAGGLWLGMEVLAWPLMAALPALTLPAAPAWSPALMPVVGMAVALLGAMLSVRVYMRQLQEGV